MRRIKAINLIILLFIITSTLSSCQWGKKRQPPKGKNIICVVDFSDSRNADDRLRYYSNVIKDNIIPKLKRYDKITVIPIDKASLTNSADIFLADLSATDFRPDQASPMEEETITKKNLDDYKAKMSKEFEASFNKAIEKRSAGSHATDLFGALDVVNRKISSRDDNYIIFLSDMMNYSNALNMEPSNTRFNNSTIDSILKEVPSYKMPGVTALVLTGEQVEVTSEYYSLVQSFWTKYFSNNEIKLFDYNSASVSKLNELMSLDVSK